MTRRQLPLIFFVLASWSFTSAAQNADTTQSDELPPRLNISTPELALKSYWAMKDWYADKRRLEIEAKCEEHASPKGERDSMIPLTTGETRRYFESFKSPSPYAFDRSVKEVIFESPSRAVLVVNIKNVTPIPAGATPSSSDIEQRQKGQGFRYVLLKESDGWRISEVWMAPRLFAPPLRLYVPEPPYYPAAVFFD